MKKLYYNGNFITMNESECDSILVNDGKIEKLNCYEEYKNDFDITAIDLQGKTMMPSFIDPHSHLLSYANNLLEAQLNDAKSFGDIVQKIKNYMAKNHIEKNQWVMANGYDHNTLLEKRHPHAYVLDLAFPDNPVIIKHISGHMCVLNSKAMQELDVNADIFPEGVGVENGKLNGYLEEKASMFYLKKIPMPSLDRINQVIIDAQNVYASYGITTVQEGMIVKEMLPLYQHILKSKILYLDTVGYVGFYDMDEVLSALKDYCGTYLDNFKIAGLKVILDGSPQGRTAWMRTPYKNGEGDYFGYGTMSSEDLQRAIAVAKDGDMQLLAHCNGDRACQQYIECVAISALKEETAKDFRPVMIHSQLLGIDQLDEVKRLNIIPSFFIAHIKYWGDIHIANFGLDRASKISPANSALSRGINFTFHQDAPVIEPNMLETIQCAVTRTTKNHVLLGESERISVYDALKATTTSCAYQYMEENTKGDIAVG
ncbi:MAG: amidohydrolase family protein, partial [Clostridia bacterium]